ncbi:MAG: imidazolonepropionase [Gammaproteobacteria bacterium]|nr:imidazolonepropionase [Gammaproteobacteria bacterium]
MYIQVLHNGLLAPMTNGADGHLQPCGSVAIEGERIAWVGPDADLPDRYARAERIDCHGHLLTPGLIDCHTHLVYGANRSEEFERRLKGAGYAEIARQGGGIMATVSATRSASVNDLATQARPRLRALMAEGVTTVEIKSGYGLERDAEIRMLEAAGRLCRDAGIRCQRTFLGAHALPTEFAGRADEYIELVCDDMLPAAANAGLVDAVDVFCEGIAFSVAQAERVFDKAAQMGLPVKCHAEQLSNTGGALMSASRRALSVDHIEYLPPGDVGKLAMSGTVAVLLPGAFYFLGETQRPPVAALRRHGVPIALATDANPGSSPVFSPLVIMNMGCILFRLTPAEALAGFTINAALALGLSDRIGSIEAGKLADLALWDCRHPAELSYHVGLNPCVGVMAGGQWRDGSGRP